MASVFKAPLLLIVFLGIVFQSYAQKTKLSKYEVSNAEFKAFLKSTGRDSVRQMQVQAWNSVVENIGPMSENYATHPAFDDYPVVGITHELAKAYCKWLSEQKKYKRFNIIWRLPKAEEYQVVFERERKITRSDFYEDYDCNEFHNLKYLSYTSRDTLLPIDGALFSWSVKRKISKENYCNLLGNVSEMTLEGMVVGGDWYSLPSEIFKEKNYTLPDPRVGFRLVREKRKGLKRKS